MPKSSKILTLESFQCLKGAILCTVNTISRIQMRALSMLMTNSADCLRNAGCVAPGYKSTVDSLVTHTSRWTAKVWVMREYVPRGRSAKILYKTSRQRFLLHGLTTFLQQKTYFFRTITARLRSFLSLKSTDRSNKPRGKRKRSSISQK